MELKDYAYNFIEKLYEYEGLWGRKSVCGLMIKPQKDSTLVIVTDIYEGNPGGTITEYCAELATKICNENKIPYKQLIFIQHSPEVNSKADFYAEEFYKVVLQETNSGFSDPDWQPLSRDQVQIMVHC